MVDTGRRVRTSRIRQYHDTSEKDMRHGRNMTTYRMCQNINCQAIFLPNKPEQVYCSKKCSFNETRRRMANSFKENPRICKYCEEKFVASMVNQIYCSNRCNNRARTNFPLNERGIPKVCIYYECNNTFYPRGSHHRCCSLKCSRKQYKIDNPEKKRKNQVRNNLKSQIALDLIEELGLMDELRLRMEAIMQVLEEEKHV